MIAPAARPAEANPTPQPMPQPTKQAELPHEASHLPLPLQTAAVPLPPQQVRPEPAFEPVRQPEPIRSVASAVPASVIPVPTIPAPAVAAAPVAAALPTEAPVTAPRPDPEAQRRWQSLLAGKLMELKRYPMLARRMGLEGVVVLEARFGTNGRAEASIKRSSGHAALDLAAVKLFEDAMEALTGKLNPPDSSRLDIPVAYRLES